MILVLFLSTLPARGATLAPDPRRWSGCNISIHAPREGSDKSARDVLQTETEFLSTLPARGATYDYKPKSLSELEFLSTLPARGATA